MFILITDPLAKASGNFTSSNKLKLVAIES
jgi:hypothetical protein